MRTGVQGGLSVSNLDVDEIIDKNARFGLNLGSYQRVEMVLESF